MAKFNCEINSPEVETLVLCAATKLMPRHLRLKALFIRGQWYVLDLDTGVVYAVYDGSGADTAYGFGLELQEKGK